MHFTSLVVLVISVAVASASPFAQMPGSHYGARELTGFQGAPAVIAPIPGFIGLDLFRRGWVVGPDSILRSAHLNSATAALVPTPMGALIPSTQMGALVSAPMPKMMPTSRSRTTKSKLNRRVRPKENYATEIVCLFGCPQFE